MKNTSTPRLIDPAIRCNADRHDADWYAVKLPNGQPALLLSFSQKEADWAAKNCEFAQENEQAAELFTK